MKLLAIEELLRFSFPDKHRLALLDSTDPVHEACDFLVPESPYELLRLVEVNEFLRSAERPHPWPNFLLAFASHGCGDYFAYDLRSESPTIIYVDPDLTVQENLASNDQLAFESYEAWYLATVRRPRAYSSVKAG